MKKLTAGTIGSVAYFFAATSAFAAPAAANPCDPKPPANTIAGAICALQSNGVGAIVQNIVVAIIVIAVLIALLYLLYGGVKWIISRGDKTEVEGARNHITAAIVGLIIVFLSIFIIYVVLKLFGLDFTSLKIPEIVPSTATTT